MDEIGLDLLSELLDGEDIEGLDEEEIGAIVKQAARMSRKGVRGERTVKTSTGTGKARALDCGMSRVAALAAAASSNLTATPTRDGVIAQMVLFSTAHDDVSVTSILVAGRPQMIGAALAPCPIVRFYRDHVDTLPVSWDSVPANQDIVVTVKNEHAATATNVMGDLVIDTVN